ncbi:MAG: patatin-like phospholipase family protein [Solirubrobacteraceae bacterium]
MRPGDIRRPAAPATLLSVDPRELLRGADDVSSPVLRVLLERARAGSHPGARSDDHVVCLAVEGGGMRGAVSAGMCVVLEAAGLVGALDCIYGVSAGALNASATAAGQAALSATHYQDAASRRVINPVRLLFGRPVVDFDFLFGELIAARKPLSFAALSSGPALRALATSLETLSLRVLRDFTDLDELMQAIRASAALPVLGGRPPVFRGERMADGGILEAIPYETALREQATHVLVLRSRPPGHRKPSHNGFAERVTVRGEPELAELMRGREDAYNTQAAELERMMEHSPDSPVFQIAVPNDTRLIGHLQPSPARVVEALRLGAEAMARAILLEPIELCWQPVAYQTAQDGAVTPARRAAPVRWRAAFRRTGALR